MDIREGINQILHDVLKLDKEVTFVEDAATEKILTFLSSKGVVRKVDRELPKSVLIPFGGGEWQVEALISVSVEALRKAGYVAVEELQ